MGEVRYTLNRNREGRSQVVGGHFAIPAWYTVEVDDPSLDFLVEIDVDMRSGTPECAAAVIMRREGGPPITTAGLRRVPLATYIAEAEPPPGRVLTKGGKPVGTGWPLSREDRAAYLRARRREERQARRRITDEDLRIVAHAYRTALSRGEHPTAAVERELHLRTRGQAARWVEKARDAGLLGPAPGRRRAGEASPEGAAPASTRSGGPPTRSTMQKVKRGGAR